MRSRFRAPDKSGSCVPKKRGLRGFRLLLAAALFLVASALRAAEFVVTFFDCGQGDAILLQMPNGKTALIDAGPLEDSGFDAGRDVVVPFLQERKIRRLDYAVMSHPHLDHIGGFRSVMTDIPVGLVYDPGYSYPSPDYKNVLQTIQDNKIKYTVVRAGEVLKWDPALKVRVLGPPPVLPWDNPNDNSLVLHVQHGQVAFLFTGDIEAQAEYELVIRYGPSLRSQILKSPHHGSSTSSTRELLDYVQPETVVISCGRFNRFRHPNRKVLSRYENDGFKVYRTDEQGHVRIVSDGKTYNVTPLGVR